MRQSPTQQTKAGTSHQWPTQAFSYCESGRETVAAFEEALAAKVCVQTVTGVWQNRAQGAEEHGRLSGATKGVKRKGSIALTKP